MALAAKQSTTSKISIDKHGRIVIPADVRRELGLEPGVALTMWVEDGQLRIMTLDAAIKQVQEMVRSKTQGRSLVNELIDERRAEAQRELRS